MRNVWCVLLCLTLCGTGLAAQEQNKLAKTIKEAIVRSDSTVFSPQVYVLPPEIEVTILKQRYDWYEIQLPPGTSGFVHSDYIQTTGPRSGFSKASGLNIRNEPDLEAQIIGRLSPKDPVEILSKDGEWYKIKAWPYSSGWVNQKSVEIIGVMQEPKVQAQTQTQEQAQEPKAPVETQAAKAQPQPQETPLEKISQIMQEKETPSGPHAPPLARGILKPSGKFFSFVSYKLENENGIILLKIPLTLWPRKYLYKNVAVWGDFDENRNYLVVNKIAERTETADIKEVKQELRQIQKTLETAVEAPDEKTAQN